jgi:hypothetical protein
VRERESVCVCVRVYVSASLCDRSQAGMVSVCENASELASARDYLP